MLKRCKVRVGFRGWRASDLTVENYSLDMAQSYQYAKSTFSFVVLAVVKATSQRLCSTISLTSKMMR